MNKFIKIKYFEPYWIIKLVDKCNIFKFKTDGSWQIRGTLINFTPLFRKEIQIFVDAFLLHVGGLNILDSIISGVMEYCRQYMELLA